MFTRFSRFQVGITGLCVCGLLISGCWFQGCSGPPAVRIPGPHIRLGENFSWSRLPDEQSDTTIIFVHGIFSSSESCWLHYGHIPKDDAYWPQIVAADESFATCAVYLAGYHTELGSGKFSISDAADFMHERLKTAPPTGQPKPLEHHNIVFVAHSTGGIVLREWLRSYPQDFKGKKVGLVLVASPSLGSNYAEWLKPVAKAYKNDMAQELSKSDPRLIGLDDQFRLLIERTDEDRGFCLTGVELLENTFIVGGEMKHLMDEVVQKGDLGKYWGKERRVGDTTHFTIAAPSGASGVGSAVHVYLRGFFLEKYQKLLCAQIGPTVEAPVIQGVRAHLSSDKKDWNIKVTFETPNDIPSNYRIRVQVSDNGTDWDGGRLDSNRPYELDYDQWRSVSGPIDDPGFSFGMIRPSARYIRLAVITPKGEVVAPSNSHSLQN